MSKGSQLTRMCVFVVVLGGGRGARSVERFGHDLYYSFRVSNIGPLSFFFSFVCVCVCVCIEVWKSLHIPLE